MRKLALIVLSSVLVVLVASCFALAGSVSEQWAGTKHNAANLGEIASNSPIMRDNCIICHDGQGFANNVTKRADLPASVRDTANGIDCAACHSSRANELMRTGDTGKLANGFQVKGAGSGALCIFCHNGRKLADPVAKPAPHASSQADVLFAMNGVRVAGVSYGSSPHAANPNTCVSCHMAEYQGVVNHTFEVIDTPAYVEKACGPCHPGLTVVNRLSLADYDGDGVIEGFQDEVQGLINLVRKEIEAKEAALGVTGAYSHGSFHWTNAAGVEVDVPAALYNAYFNVTLVEDDGSLGIHNPAYVVNLLQRTYEELTGKPVPNAVIR